MEREEAVDVSGQGPFDQQFSEPDSQEQFDQMLERMRGMNPRLMMMTEMMKKFNEQGNTVRECEELKSEIESMKEVVRRHVKENLVLKKKYDTVLRGHLQIMQAIEPIASALGACPNCLGMVRQCRECGGTGEAGAYVPVMREFEEYCVPAAARLGLSIIDRNGSIDGEQGSREIQHRPMGPARK